MSNEYSLIDPIVLSNIDDLMLLARTVVDGFSTGLHRSGRFGTSIEFAQYRPYVQGDDPRFVDWDLYARTDRLHTKQFQEETNMRCTLLLDCSGSMDYASGEITKFAYARMLSACLAILLFRQKDAVGLIGFEEKLKLYIPPRISTPHLRRIFVELTHLHPEGKTDIAKALEYLGNVMPSRGMVILISDFLQPSDEMLHYLKLLKAKRHDVILFQISDPAEQTFPFQRSMTYIDAESDQELFIVPESVRDEYLQNRNHHFQTIQNECISSEIEIEEFITTDPLDRVLHKFITSRARLFHSYANRGGRSAFGGR